MLSTWLYPDRCDEREEYLLLTNVQDLLCDDFFYTSISIYNDYYHFLQLPILRLLYSLIKPLTADAPCSLVDDRKDRLPTGDGQSIFAGRAFVNLSSSFSLVTGDRLATSNAGSALILHAKVLSVRKTGLDDSSWCTRVVNINMSKRSRCISSIFA